MFTCTLCTNSAGTRCHAREEDAASVYRCTTIKRCTEPKPK